MVTKIPGEFGSGLQSEGDHEAQPVLFVPFVGDYPKCIRYFNPIIALAAEGKISTFRLLRTGDTWGM